MDTVSPSVTAALGRFCQTAGLCLAYFRGHDRGTPNMAQTLSTRSDKQEVQLVMERLKVDSEEARSFRARVYPVKGPSR